MEKIIFMMIYDLIGTIFIGVSIVCFAVAADFAPGGVNGIVVIKKKRPKMTFGLLAFAVDGMIVLLSIFVFKEALAFIYGMVYTIVTSVALDLCTLVLKKCHLTYVDCEEI